MICRLFLLAFLVFSFIAPAIAQSSGTASSDLSIRPYIMEQVQFIGSGDKQVPVSQEIKARRRDGAVHRTVTYKQSDGIPERTLRRVDFPDGKVGMISDSVGAKSTGKRPQAAQDALNASVRNPPAKCTWPGELTDGDEVLFGFKTFRVVRQQADDLNRIIEWRMPDFNCLTVQGFIQDRSSKTAPWLTKNGTRLTAFAEADPDPRLYTNWSVYTEMKPSDMKRKLLQNSGITPSACPKCFEDEKSDTVYQKFQK